MQIKSLSRFFRLFTGVLLTNALIANPFTFSDGIENWGPHNGNLGLFLSFKDDMYTFDMQGPGGMTCSGKYSSNGNRIQLKQGSKDHNGSVDCSPRICQIKTSSSSLSKKRFMQCGNMRFWSSHPSDAVAANQSRKVGKTPVSTINKIGSTNADHVRMRLGPGTQFKKNLCNMLGGSEQSATLSKKTNLYVLARTIKKQRIGKMNAYWYYIHKDSTDDSICDHDYFWVYGKFVDLED